LSAKDIADLVLGEVDAAADDGSALLAVVSLERVLGRQLKIGLRDVDAAVALGKTVSKRCVAFLDSPEFAKLDLNLTKRSFFELRDMIAEGLDSNKLAEQLAVIADDDLKVSFGAVVNDALTFLRNRLPAAPARSRNDAPGDFKIAAFTRAWRTLSDPLTVLSDLEQGCLSVDQVRTLVAVYPRLHTLMANAMTAAVMERAVDPEYVVPYRKLKQISVLLQQPLVPEDLKGILAQSFASPEADVDLSAAAAGGNMSTQSASQNQKLEFGL
jgi:hypothetical protein